MYLASFLLSFLFLVAVIYFHFFVLSFAAIIVAGYSCLNRLFLCLTLLLPLTTCVTTTTTTTTTTAATAATATTTISNAALAVQVTISGFAISGISVVSVLLYFCASVLLYFCASVLLYFCTSVLLYFCTSVLLG